MGEFPHVTMLSVAHTVLRCEWKLSWTDEDIEQSTNRSRDSSVGIVTRRLGWTIQCPNGDRVKRYLSTPKCPYRHVAHPALNSMDNGILSRWQSSRDVKLTTDLHLVPRWRMSGAIRLLPQYAFVTWTGKTLPSTIFIQAVRVVSLGGEVRTPDLPARSKCATLISLTTQPAAFMSVFALL